MSASTATGCAAATTGFRIAVKRAELDMTDLRSVGDVAIIL